MVETADLRNGHDLAPRARLGFPRIGRVAPQRQMRSGFMVVAQVGSQYPKQVRLVQHNHVIQTIAASQFRTFDGVLESGNLLSQCEVLDGASVAPDECPD